MADGAVVLFPDLYTNQFGVEEMKERVDESLLNSIDEDQSLSKTGLATTNLSPAKTRIGNRSNVNTVPMSPRGSSPDFDDRHVSPHKSSSKKHKKDKKKKKKRKDDDESTNTNTNSLAE